MKQYFYSALILVFVGGLTLFLFSCGQNASAHTENVFNEKNIVIMEMFTSEGCSSCPAAEKTAELLDEDATKRGTTLIILDFHVDYWDYLGWKDPFANPFYTQRQQTYSRKLHLESIYTPQSIVNGTKECVGSDFEKLSDFIHSSYPKNDIHLKIQGVEKSSDALNISYKSDNIPKGTILNIALAQDNAESNVKRGENAGKKLIHHNIVLAFSQLPEENLRGNSVLKTSGINFNKGLEVVAYLQDPNSMKILAADRFKLILN